MVVPSLWQIDSCGIALPFIMNADWTFSNRTEVELAPPLLLVNVFQKRVQSLQCFDRASKSMEVYSTNGGKVPKNFSSRQESHRSEGVCGSEKSGNG